MWPLLPVASFYWGKSTAGFMFVDAYVRSCQNAPVARTVCYFSCLNHSDAEYVCVGASFLMTGQTVVRSTDRKKQARQRSAVARKQGTATHHPVHEKAIQVVKTLAKLLSSKTQQVHRAPKNSNDTAEQQPDCGHEQQCMDHAGYQTNIC